MGKGELQVVVGAVHWYLVVAEDWQDQVVQGEVAVVTSAAAAVALMAGGGGQGAVG